MMRISKSTKTDVKASNSTSDYKQCLKDALVAKGGYKKSDVVDQSIATLESWAKDAGIDIDNICACGDIKASVDSDIAKYKKSLERKAAKSGVYEDFGRDELRALKDKYPTLPDDNTDPRTAEHNRRSIDSFDSWCGNFDLSSIKSSTDTDKALQHIKAAIDILGKSGMKDDVTKDSIANLGVVMFDLKGKK